MNRLWTVLLIGVCLVPAGMLADGTDAKVATPLIAVGAPQVAVDFELVRQKTHCQVVVTITNRSHKDISIEHPGNRSALAFLVMNEHGNVIEPIGFAKVNRVKYEDISLKPGEIFRHTVRGAGGRRLFQFLTGTALFGYELEFGKTYRIVAVYRPEGPDGDGICSKEKAITYEAHLHELKT